MPEAKWQEIVDQVMAPARLLRLEGSFVHPPRAHAPVPYAANVELARRLRPLPLRPSSSGVPRDVH